MSTSRHRRGGALSVAAAALLLFAPAAFAAPPANDDFANREVLSGSLPIEVVRSNVEATKEEGEFIPGLAPAGHSVWFEWEAEKDGWMTIGTCDDEFPTILAVFTGTELGNLIPVASGNADEGPDCPYSQRQYTFKAVSGLKYVAAVDGSVFHLPEAPTPVTEGEVVLRIEETPTPLNDAFEDATTLAGSISEEPGGDRFYFAHAQGFTWNATTEIGEPGTASSGASVWYTWTAPEEATYRFGSPCCGTGLALDLYLGDAVDELTPFLVGFEFAEVHLIGGKTVRIRVSGPLDPETEEPRMANFDFNISAELAPRKPDLQTPNPSKEVPKTQPPLPPETKILQRTFRPRVGLARFRFSSGEGGSFQCRLDKGSFNPCASPKIYRHLRPGHHTFRVRAIAVSGLTDPTAAVDHFLIARPKGRKGPTSAAFQ